MKRSICALTLCLALLAGLLTPTALAAGEKPAFSQQPQSTTVTARHRDCHRDGGGQVRHLRCDGEGQGGKRDGGHSGQDRADIDGG